VAISPTFDAGHSQFLRDFFERLVEINVLSQPIDRTCMVALLALK